MPAGGDAQLAVTGERTYLVPVKHQTAEERISPAEGFKELMNTPDNPG